MRRRGRSSARSPWGSSRTRWRWPDLREDCPIRADPPFEGASRGARDPFSTFRAASPSGSVRAGGGGSGRSGRAPLQRWGLALLGMVVALVALASEAQAIPEFARKYGRTCSSCHTPFFPDLNRSGRQFKENGYRLSEGEEKASAKAEAERETLPHAALLQDLPLSLRIQSSVEIPWSPRASNRNNVDFDMFETVYVTS